MNSRGRKICPTHPQADSESAPDNANLLDFEVDEWRSEPGKIDADNQAFWVERNPVGHACRANKSKKHSGDGNKTECRNVLKWDS
jgi:hypothetical protein